MQEPNAAELQEEPVNAHKGPTLDELVAEPFIEVPVFPSMQISPECRGQQQPKKQFKLPHLYDHPDFGDMSIKQVLAYRAETGAQTSRVHKLHQNFGERLDDAL